MKKIWIMWQWMIIARLIIKKNHEFVLDELWYVWWINLHKITWQLFRAFRMKTNDLATACVICCASKLELKLVGHHSFNAVFKIIFETFFLYIIHPINSKTPLQNKSQTHSKINHKHPLKIRKNDMRSVFSASL